MKSGAIATIDCGVVAGNFRALQAMCHGAEVAATIKADAYGLGAPQIAKTLVEAGCRSFYVAHYSEALQLRAQHKDVTIFVLHGIPAGAEQGAHQHNITSIITDLGALERMRDAAKAIGKKIQVNIHIDTGMNRIGLSESEWYKLSETHSLLEGIDTKWVMSHFACSDEPHNQMNEHQREKFIKATKHFAASKKTQCKLTLANSHGIYLGKQMHFDQVRPGRALSGTNGLSGLKNALSLHAPIIQLRSIDSDGTVGYGATHRVQQGMRLAALAYGYADGLHRAFSNHDHAEKHHVYLHGIPVPIMGRVSMDLVMVDVSLVPEHLVHVGAMVEIAGTHQSIDDFATQIGTIGYELMTGLGQRIERHYLHASGEIKS